MHPVIFIIIVIYLLLTTVLGFYLVKDNKTTEGYFVGNRSFSGWLIGLSMFSTIIRSTTFLALPAAAFILDWRQLTVDLVMPFAALFAIIIFIPFYRKRNLTSVFEYLGARFGKVPRIYGAISFIILHLIKMAEILFLASIVIHLLTGVSIVYVAIILSVFIGLYTVTGGISAVIWTDAFQAIVLLVGALICLIWMADAIPGGVSKIIDVGRHYGKFSLGSMHFDLSKRTFYTVISLGIINWIGIFIGGQNMVQRYVAARSTREARKATILFSVLALSIWTLFFFVGTALFVYYIYFPNPMTAEFEADYVLPHFILSNLPPVVSGIIISAIMAAVMSSISSSCNAISTISVIDFMKGWLAKDKSDAHYLKIARLITVLILVLVCLGGVSFNYIEKESMNDISLIVDSVFGGCITGLFIIGLFTGRVDNFSATIAIVFAIAFNIYIGLGLLGLLPSYWTLPIQSYWVGVFVNGVFITLAYIVSVFRTKSFKKPDSLTIWSSSYERGKNSS